MKESELGYVEGTKFIPYHGNGETISDYIDVLPNEVFTIQTWATSNNVDPQHYMFDYVWYTDKNLDSYIASKRIAGGNPGFNHGIGITAPAPGNAKYMRIVARLYSDGKVKVERGSVATPWSPAPEDIITHTEFDELVKRVEALEDKLAV